MGVQYSIWSLIEPAFSDARVSHSLHQIFYALGLGKGDHYPDAALTAALDVLLAAAECFPNESGEWRERHAAVCSCLQLAQTIRNQGAPLRYLTASRQLGGNPYAGHFTVFPIAASISQDFDHSVLPAARTLQALLLRASICQDNFELAEQLDRYARLIRLSHLRNHPIRDLFIRIAPSTDTDRSSPKFWPDFRQALPATDRLHNEVTWFINFTTQLINGLVDRPPLNPTSPRRSPERLGQTPLRNLFDIVAKPSVSSSKVPAPSSRRALQFSATDNESDPESPEHLDLTFSSTSPRAADVQPASPEREQLELKYCNYNTALDNQMLPATWYTLSQVELGYLAHCLRTDLLKPHAGAVWVSLLLMTGQTIEQVHRMATTPANWNEDYIAKEGVWYRAFRLPKEAFAPRLDQRPFLNESSNCFALPFPDVVAKAAQLVVPTVSAHGDGLQIIESSVRTYAQQLRDRSGLRFSPGRIAGSLKPAVMSICRDQVAVHLIAGRRQDAPPSGIFYASYRPATLSKIYQETVNRLLGGHI